MTDPTNKDIAEALRSITDLPLGASLILRLAADRLDPPTATAEECGDPDDGWIKWGGEWEAGPVPQSKDVLEIKFRDGDTRVTSVPYMLRWTHENSFGDIIAYRVIK